MLSGYLAISPSIQQLTLFLAPHSYTKAIKLRLLPLPSLTFELWLGWSRSLLVSKYVSQHAPLLPRRLGEINDFEWPEELNGKWKVMFLAGSQWIGSSLNREGL